MKKNFFMKIMMVCSCFVGAFVMASCQSTSHNDVRFETEAQYDALTNERDPNYTVKIIIGVANPTIFNIKHFNIIYEVFGSKGTETKRVENQLYECDNFVISHGVAGYIGREVLISKEEAKTRWDMTNVNYMKISKIDNIQFQSVWETYIVWWIICLVLLGISTIAFATTIFKKNLSIENAKKLLEAHVASSMTTLLLILLICLIPLMFSGWVVTVMLLGTFAAHFVVAFLLCAIKTKIGHKNIPNNFQDSQQ